MSPFEPGPASRFIGASSAAIRGGYAIFGAPYDGTASFRAGSRFGPDAIRAASHGLETYSPAFDADLEDVDYADVGDIPMGFGDPGPALESVERAVGELLDDGVTPVMLGGEHSLTAAAFRAVHRRFDDAAVVQLDAHADLRDEYLGEPNSHACAMRRCIDTGADLIQLGVRSGTREEWRWMRSRDTLVGPDQLVGRLRSLRAPIYLTVDVDVFDPGVVPGTGTPEPGGIGWHDFQRVAEALRDAEVDLLAFDVMELAPALDPGGRSAIVAAKIVRELMLILAV